MTTEEQYSASRGIQSIEVGNQLLTFLMRTPEPAMLKDLAAAADITPAQAHAYLTSFKRVELVEQDPQSGRYAVGPMALRLAMARLHGVEPLSSASRAAAALAQSLGTLVNLVVWGSDIPVALQTHTGANDIDVNLRAGTSFSVTGSADGWVFGAFMKSEALSKRIDAEFNGLKDYGIGTPPSPEEFEAEMERTRERGYARRVSSPLQMLTTVSAPVIGPTGNLELALSIVGFSDNMDVTPNSSFIRALLNTTQRLARNAPTIRMQTGS